MPKCSVCKGKIQETFLKKIRGTYIGKKPVCNECQKKLSVKEIKEKI